MLGFHPVHAGAVVLFMLAGGATAQAASCVLKAENSKGTPGCKVVVGYSDGQRVGNFRTSRSGDKQLVGLTKACLGAPYYNDELGRIIAPNKLSVGGLVYVLSDDCRRSTRE